MNNGLSPWKNKNKIKLLIGLILGIPFILIDLSGLFIWITIMFATKAWPESEQFIYSHGFESKQYERSQKIESHKEQSFSFWNPIILGFGDPGDSTDEHAQESWTEPLRLSSIYNLLLSFSISWLIMLLPLESLFLTELLPGWGWYWNIPITILNTLFIFVCFQQIASTLRRSKDEAGAIYQPVHYDPEIFSELTKNDYAAILAKGIIPIGLITTLIYFLGNQNLLITILPSIFAALVALWTIGYWQISKPIVHEFFEYIISQKEMWGSIWEIIPAYKGVSPQYIFEQNSPAKDPTFKEITFQVNQGEAGVKPLMDEGVVKGLMTTLGTDVILVGTYPKQGSFGSESDTRQEAVFKIGYPLAPGGSGSADGGPEDQADSLGSKYHLKKELDRETRNFYSHASMQAAFRALKIPQPVFESAKTLTQTTKENDESQNDNSTIIETIWNIEDTGLTYNKLREKTLDLQAELGVKWLRIGRRTENIHDKQSARPNKKVSIVYSLEGNNSLHPSNNYPSNRQQSFAHSLEWSWQMTSLKLPELLFIDNQVIATENIEQQNNEEQTENNQKQNERRRNRRERPAGRMRNIRNIAPPAIQSMEWLLPEGTKYEDIAKHTEAIREKMGLPWLRISEPTTDFGEESVANIISFYYGVNPNTNEIKYKTRSAEQKIQSLNWIHTLRQTDWKFFGIQIEKTIDHSKEKNKTLIEAILHLPSSLTYVDVLKSRDKIAEKFGTPYFEIYRRSIIPKTTKWTDDSYASFIFGNEIGEMKVEGTNISYTNVNPRSSKYLNMVEWGSAFKKVELIDTDGTTPIATGNIEKPLGVTVTTFKKIGKLSEEDFERKLPNLKTVLQVKHLKIDYTQEANSFTIEHASKDPLANNFDFNDFIDILLLDKPPTPGNGIIDFGLGIGTTGEIIKLEFEEGAPHIAIGAASGSGKSYLLRAIILSWLYNNHPDSDLWLFLIEPKKGLEGYAKYPHVKAFVTNDTPAYQQVPEFMDEEKNIMNVDPLIVGSSDIYDWMQKEMVRREQLYKKYEQELDVRIEKLPEARAIAKQEMEKHGLKNHELLLPWIVMCAEEAPQFMREVRAGGSVSKEKAAMVSDIRRIGEAISQRARATGVVLLNISQSMKNESFPIEIKNNSRMIGLTCKTPRQSINIWGDSTLENLGKPGRGIFSDPDTGDVLDFRAFFVPMGEPTDDKDEEGNPVMLPDYFAENLGHLEVRDEPLNGWSEQAMKMHKPKFAVIGDVSIKKNSVPAPSDFVLNGTDEF